jgi:hypothetical protein
MASRILVAMTKSLGPFEYGKAPRSPSGLAGKRGRSYFSIAFDALFPLAIVAVAYAIGRSFFGF